MRNLLKLKFSAKLCLIGKFEQPAQLTNHIQDTWSWRAKSGCGQPGGIAICMASGPFCLVCAFGAHCPF